MTMRLYSHANWTLRTKKGAFTKEETSIRGGGSEGGNIKGHYTSHLGTKFVVPGEGSEP